MTSPIPAPVLATRTRIGSIDVLRGLVMVIMALDHTREYFHTNAFFYNAVDLQTTTPFLFFTRWITHFCAPTFVFLAGMSAYLAGQRRTPAQRSRFLLTRGLWLIVLEVTIINFALWFDPTFSIIALQVIWAIGFSMVVLSLLVYLPNSALWGISFVILVVHNALDGVDLGIKNPLGATWTLLHKVVLVPLSEHLIIGNLYPVLPWLGIMVLGYCLGPLYGPGISIDVRKKRLYQIGAFLTIGFLVLRFLNSYGDSGFWKPQSTPLYTVMSFLNTNKYPPSLLFTFMTLGPALLFLGWIEGKQGSWMRFFTVYGAVPLFYFIVHFYLIHSLSILRLLASGTPWESLNFQQRTGGMLPDLGLPLGLVYLVWASVVLIMYPICKWYGAFKKRQTGWVWSYL